MAFLILNQNEEATEVETSCPRCRSTDRVVMPTKGWKAWLAGALLIQDALPSLTNPQREQLITGYCDLCWAKIFPED